MQTVNKIQKYVVIPLILLGALLCIFTPEHYYFKFLSTYAVQMMFSYLFLGIVFLFAKKPQLTFASFLACGLIALHLKVSTNSDLKSPEVTQDAALIKVAHIDVSGITDDPEGMVQSIIGSNASLVSIPNLDPYVFGYLQEELKEAFPHNTGLVGFEPAMAVFSKYAIEKQDTFFIEGLPNISGCIKTEGNGKEWHFLTSNTLPPFYTKEYQRLQNQLIEVAKRAKKINAPIITIADYNLVPWQVEIVDFRENATLIDSRRGFSPAASTSFLGGLFGLPHEHIFHTDHFKCISFNNLKYDAGHLGIISTFQFKPTSIYAEGTTQ